MAELPLAALPLTVLRERMHAGACTALDIVDSCLSRIAAHNDSLGAFVHMDAGAVRADAQAADRARATGDRRPLLGLPVAIKDVLQVAGQPCTCGSRILEGYTAPYDATVVARLRAAGAIPFGRTNMDEFAMGSGNETSAHGPAHNPWDLSRVPGGSSGGSAAAVAAGLVPAALGSDTGGSIRQPSAFCGCVGLKPTYGRVSRYGLTAFASSLDQVGPMTRTVADAALLLGVLAGWDERDSTSIAQPIPDYMGAVEAAVAGLRVGLPREYFVGGIEPAVERAVRAAVAGLEARGARVVEIEMPHTEYAVATYYIIAAAEASANLARFDGVRYGRRAAGASDPFDLHARSRAAGFGAEVKRRIILGTYVLSSGYHDAYYLRAQQVRTLIRGDFERAFERCDVLACPVAPTVAWPLGSLGDEPLRMYLRDIFTVTANLAGICGLSVPCGFDEAGLPVGLQLLGPALGEATLLRAAAAVEAAEGGPAPLPAAWQGGGVP